MKLYPISVSTSFRRIDIPFGFKVFKMRQFLRSTLLTFLMRNSSFVRVLLLNVALHWSLQKRLSDRPTMDVPQCKQVFLSIAANKNAFKNVIRYVILYVFQYTDISAYYPIIIGYIRIYPDINRLKYFTWPSFEHENSQHYLLKTLNARRTVALPAFLL